MSTQQAVVVCKRSPDDGFGCEVGMSARVWTHYSGDNARVGIPEIGRLVGIGRAIIGVFIKEGVIESATAVVECNARWDRNIASGAVRVDIKQTWPAAWRPRLKTRSAVEAAA